MISPLSGVLHEKWGQKDLLGPLWVAPRNLHYNKTLRNMAPADCQASRRGPRLVPSSPEPPARLGGEGLAQVIPPRQKREREKKN